MIEWAHAPRPYRKRLYELSDNATTFDIEDTQTEPGEARKIGRLSVENRTSNYTRLTIGIVTRDIFFVFEEEDSPQANNVYWFDRPLWIYEREYLRIRLEGTTVNDEIHVFLEGVEGEVARKGIHDVIDLLREILDRLNWGFKEQIEEFKPKPPPKPKHIEERIPELYHAPENDP